MGKTKPDRLVQTWKLDVGFEERHQVQIIKKRPKVLAGLRPSIFRVFVDGELVEERKGY
jgi:hypothetical protein